MFSANDKSHSRNLSLAFDVGHSSIGWAALESSPGESPELLGCGAVIFQADDCLASQRRGFRRQRRHIRATRLRIARLKKVFAQVGVLTMEELDHPGCTWPWLLAARVLRGGDKLDGSELWDVLRWYAHNRGYDGNRDWSRNEEEAAAQQEDVEKVNNARALYAKYGTSTMAETFCAVCGLDPFGKKKSVALPGNERFKALNAAFPREDVAAEVRRILEAHVGALQGVDDHLIEALLTDWKAIPAAEIQLPERYRGGLLFGQLVPRFDNRIIARCPITFEEIYQRVLSETRDEEQAKHEAQKHAKVPGRACAEFHRFRWAMQVANVQVAATDGHKPRPLSVAERQQVDAKMRVRGVLTPGEFKKAVRDATDAAPNNLEQMLIHPDAKEALLVDPVQRIATDPSFAPFFALLEDGAQRRVRGKLRRGQPVTLSDVREMLTSPASFDDLVTARLDAANTRKGKKTAGATREQLLGKVFQVKPVTGRAPHTRQVMAAVADFVFSTNRHPAEEGGPLYRSETIRLAQLQRAIDKQTNNHLVRHRLRLLDRLHRDLIKEYANGERERVSRIAIEVNRNLRELSGENHKSTNLKEILNKQLRNFKGVKQRLEKAFAGKNITITAGLLRKARIADDLGWTCPYTGKQYDEFDLLFRRVDKDHIVPRSERASDSLDSQVITFSEVNKLKGKRTAYRFMEAEQSSVVPGRPDLMIRTLTGYQEWVGKLETFKGHEDDKRRKRRRKELLLLPDYVEKEFTPRDLTQTSQLVRLGAQALERVYLDAAEKPVVTSIPGSVTGAIRKSWDLVGCLATANPNVMNPGDLDENGKPKVRTKTEIRGITHLHHALDACVLVLSDRFLPRDGGVWDLLLKRRVTPEQAARLRERLGQNIQIAQDGSVRLTDLPPRFKEQIRQRLAERRVVQHIPADMEGMHAEQNAWRVVGVENGEVWLRQRMRQPDGSRPMKETKEKVRKVVGLDPERSGKLARLKAALVISDNYGLALDPEPEIIPFHKVWVRLRELRERNGNRAVRVLRNGMLIHIPRGLFAGTWKIFSVKNNASGLAVNIGHADVVRLENKTEGHKINVRLATLLRDGLQIAHSSLAGLAEPSEGAT